MDGQSTDGSQAGGEKQRKRERGVAAFLSPTKRIAADFDDAVACEEDEMAKLKEIVAKLENLATIQNVHREIKKSVGELVDSVRNLSFYQEETARSATIMMEEVVRLEAAAHKDKRNIGTQVDPKETRMFGGRDKRKKLTPEQEKKIKRPCVEDSDNESVTCTEKEEEKEEERRGWEERRRKSGKGRTVRTFSEVVGYGQKQIQKDRGNKKGPTSGTGVGRMESKKDRKEKGKKSRMRGDAIAITVGEKSTFAEALKKVKDSMGQELEGVEGIRQVRSTRTGQILLEMNKKADSAALADKLGKKIGGDLEIRRLVPKGEVEIMDIDPMATREEIQEAVVQLSEAKKEEVVVRVLRRSFQNMQLAVIACPDETKGKLLKEGRIRIGWAWSRMRGVPKITRCFACHGFGHLAIHCRDNKRGAMLCRRCGDEGHTFKECKGLLECRLCKKKGIKGNMVAHLAGSVKCYAYKEAMKGAAG